MNPNNKNKSIQNLINCHTHIFTIDHVPNEFSKSLLPSPLHKVFTINMVKWWYNNFTTRGSENYKNFIRRKNKIVYGIIYILKYTKVLWWIYLIVMVPIRWFGKILLNFLTLESILSKEVQGLISRYITLARYSANYVDQASVFNYLKKNYPSNTKFIVLSMDMEYMGAGCPKISYLDQIKQLVKIKKNKPEMLPFIFADPRRIRQTKDMDKNKNYEVYLKSLLEKKLFNGIKMYPALGYYPFDKELMPMYEFAQKNDIPLMTHCIEGTVFYRGKKKPEWSRHPILTYNKEGGNREFISLPQKNNYHFTTNFTHPLNYHCLLSPKLLSHYMGREMDLSNLKICLAHFGGSEEWNKYKADAWNNYNNNISPDSLEEYSKRKNTLNHGAAKTIWWNASWLSIIYDLMVEYKNVYTDVSFILFNEELFPLLKYILMDDKVKYKILFGTDYYVVSQKGVDKVLYQNLRSYLGEELFNLIADKNPQEYIKTKLS